MAPDTKLSLLTKWIQDQQTVERRTRRVDDNLQTRTALQMFVITSPPGIPPQPSNNFAYAVGYRDL